ncbi:hypothetical protein ACFL5V_05155 [Fibrobacterota bacterium]
MSDNRDAKIAYAVAPDQIMVLDLTTGTLEELTTITWSGNEWQPFINLAWSPSGDRLALGTESEVVVINKDKSNRTVISTDETLLGKMVSWLDDDATVVYSVCEKVVGTTIGTDNSVVSTTDLYTVAPTRDNVCWEDTYVRGDYLSMLDFEANMTSGGYHRPVVIHLPTGELRELVSRDGDGCNINPSPEGNGTVIFTEENHIDPAKIVNWDGEVIDELAYMVEPVDNEGIQQLRWSNEVEYLAHMGSRDYQRHAWIRKMSDKSAVYFGSDLIRPNLWVAPESAPVRQENRKSSIRHNLKSGDRAVYTLQGQRIMSGEKYGPGLYVTARNGHLKLEIMEIQ